MLGEAGTALKHHMQFSLWDHLSAIGDTAVSFEVRMLPFVAFHVN